MYILLIITSALLALVSTPAVMRLARALAITDAPGLRKVHVEAIPLLGGVVVALAALLGLGSTYLLSADLRLAASGAGQRGLVLLAASGVMLLLGLVDDWRSVPARKKLLAQFAAAVAVCLAGIRIERIAFGAAAIELGYLSWPFTVLWIVGLTNAVNLIDGLDGLAAGICAIAGAVIGSYAIAVGQPFLGCLLLALASSLLGFLSYNFNPARIFLGDAGTYFIGFLLGAGSAAVVSASGQFEGLGVAVLALGVPLFDTFFSMLRRLLQRRSIFAPDRSHVHHRLLAMGLHQRQAVLVVYAVTVTLGLLATLLFFTRGLESLAVMGCGGLVLIVLFRKVGSFRLRESVRTLMRNWSISRDAAGAKKRFEEAQLRLREADSFQRWWQGVCVTAAELGLVRLSLRSSRNGRQQRMDWSSPFFVDTEKTLQMTFPVTDRRKGSTLRILVHVHLNGSLEAAGMRGALFGRLMDECGLHFVKGKEVSPPGYDFAMAPGSATLKSAVGGAPPEFAGVIKTQIGKKVATAYEESGS